MKKESSKKRGNNELKIDKIDIVEKYLKEARNLYKKVQRELEEAKDKADSALLRDVCSKAWLAAVEATNAFFLKKV